MTDYEKSLVVLDELFGRDCTFVLATSRGDVPGARVVDTYYEDGVFWVVTHAASGKMSDIGENPHVALCNSFHCFRGRAVNVGHPLREENRAVRGKLVEVFAPWYFAHNDEGDEGMCFVRIEPVSGVFHKDGSGYRVDFVERTAEVFAFAPDIEMEEI